MGKFKPRANKKKSKRTVYFGLVVFKDPKSVENILSDSTFLQAKINKLARKTVGYVQNPFESKIVESDDESEVSETELANRAHKEMMEEGGFTQVKEDDFGAIKRVKGREKTGTVMKGISLDDLREKA